MKTQSTSIDIFFRVKSTLWKIREEEFKKNRRRDLLKIIKANPENMRRNRIEIAKENGEQNMERQTMELIPFTGVILNAYNIIIFTPKHPFL